MVASELCSISSDVNIDRVIMNLSSITFSCKSKIITHRQIDRSYTTYFTEPHDFRNLINAVNVLTFWPTLGDNNATLNCVANKSRPERLEHVAVTLNVSCE